jgi:hypothetical protein
MKRVTRVLLTLALVSGFMWVVWQAMNQVAWEEGGSQWWGQNWGHRSN